MRTNKIRFPEYFSPQVQNVIGPDGGSGCLLWHFWLLPIRQSARICWYARYGTCCSNCIGRRSFRLPADFLPCSQRRQPWLLLRSCKRPSFSGPTPCIIPDNEWKISPNNYIIAVNNTTPWSRALPTHDSVMYGGMHRVPREVYIDIHHNFVHKL